MATGAMEVAAGAAGVGGAAVLLKPAVAKLLDTVADQVRLGFQPWHTRRQAEADAAARGTVSRARCEEALAKVENEIALKTVRERAIARLCDQEVKRQENIEAVTKGAEAELPEQVNETPVDPDWVSRFFEACQDVSNADMQRLWSRLLAGEVARPGTFSLRTLNTVRTLGRPDAELVAKLYRYVWTDSSRPIVFYPDECTWGWYWPGRFSYAELQQLQSVGVIRPEVQGICLNRNAGFELTYFGTTYRFQRCGPPQPHHGQFRVGPYWLTDVGAELAPAVGGSADDKYLAALVAYHKQVGWQAERVG